jgi:hypothetical protein
MTDVATYTVVMRGLDPRIHAFLVPQDVDARHKAGHDAWNDGCSHRHCERSEAIQTGHAAGKDRIASSLTLLAMTG